MLRGVLVAASLLAAASVALAAEGGPGVTLTDRDPVTVRGFGFGQGERVTVRVVIRGGPRETTLVRAGPRGGFVAAFPGLAVTQCTAYTIQALGWRGSRASRVQLPPPCGPSD
jgi:hypothetical protein